MICILQKTLKASPLSNRGCAVPPDYPTTGKMHPKGMPHQESGHNGQGQNGHLDHIDQWRVCSRSAIEASIIALTKSQT